MVITFYVAAAVALISTVMVITRLNAVHALLYMILSLLSVAIIFYTLGAPFIAALEVITYAGAIMVLFVFVVMLLNLGPQTIVTERQWLKPRAWIGPGILALILLIELIYLVSGTGNIVTGTEITPKQVSVALFGTYLLGVELGSMLLLAGLVGAYHLGRRLEVPVSQTPIEPEPDSSGVGE
jgi:NADH-quinone oxidoreductase subunit J